MDRPQRLRLLRPARVVALALAAAFLPGCYVAPYYAPGYTVPASFDRSWDAAVGAMLDNGLAITRQDRSTGTVVGTRGATDVQAQLNQQADGSVRVEFTTRRANNEDPGLITRVTNAYQQRMGR